MLLFNLDESLFFFSIRFRLSSDFHQFTFYGKIQALTQIEILFYKNKRDTNMSKNFQSSF